MRAWLLLVLLFSSVVLLGQNADSPSHSAGAQAQQTQSVTPSPLGTEKFSGHCPSAQKTANPDAPHGKVSRGRLIHKVNPTYPAELRKAHVEGTVLLCATIGKDGKLHNLLTLSGPAELIPYARDAVEQWRYKPYRVNKEPVDVDSEIRVDFRLAQ